MNATVQKIIEAGGKIKRKKVDPAIMLQLIAAKICPDQKTNAKLSNFGKEIAKTWGLIDEPLDPSKGYVGSTPDLGSYDIILLNTSGGKDSQVMIHVMVEAAKAAGVEKNLVAVHADLGRVEWKDTKALVALQCQHYNIPIIFTHRTQNDLLDQIEKRGMFPDNKNRFCTSDHKRGPIRKVMTQLVRHAQAGQREKRKIRILNCMGMRAQESTARAMKADFSFCKSASNKTKRHVDDFLPIHDMLVDEVWNIIKASGCPYHFAYDLGMPRLSCCFCIFASRDALLLSGKHNPELLKEYVKVEEKIGHTFKQGLSLKSVLDDLNAGHQPKKVSDWTM